MLCKAFQFRLIFRCSATRTVLYNTLCNIAQHCSNIGSNRVNSRGLCPRTPKKSAFGLQAPHAPPNLGPRAPKLRLGLWTFDSRHFSNLDRGHAQPGHGTCPTWTWDMPNLDQGHAHCPWTRDMPTAPGPGALGPILGALGPRLGGKCGPWRPKAD